MATLRKRGKCYSAYIRRKVNGRYFTYETFNLGRIKKTQALDYLTQINKAEWKIINGKLAPKDYPTWFSWLNDKGIYEVEKIRTLGETIDEFLSDKEDDIRKSSLDRIRISMDRLLEVIPAKTKLLDIKNPHIKQFKKHFKKKHRPAGINLNLRNIKTFFRWCYDEEFMDRIPKIVIKKVKQSIKYISEENIIKVLDVCPPLYRKVFRVYLETGKRRSELIDGYLRENILVIPVQDGLKSDEPHCVTLEPHQLEIIKELHKDRDKFLAQGYLLKSYKNRYTKTFTKKLKELGIYEIWDTKLHSLRHSQCVMEYLKTRDVKAVMDKMNHSQLSTTLLYSKTNALTELDFPTATELGEITKKVQENAKCDNSVRQFKQLN